MLQKIDYKISRNLATIIDRKSRINATLYG